MDIVQKTDKIQLLYDSAISLPGVYSKKMEQICSLYIFTAMFSKSFMVALKFRGFDLL